MKAAETLESGTNHEKAVVWLKDSSRKYCQRVIKFAPRKSASAAQGAIPKRPMWGGHKVYLPHGEYRKTGSLGDDSFYRHAQEKARGFRQR